MDLEQIKSPLPPRKLSPTLAEESEEKVVPQIPVDRPVETPIEAPITRSEDKVQKNFKWIIVVVVLIVLALVLFFVFFNKKESKTDKNITLNYWGLWEEPIVINGIIADFEKENPDIKINYIRHQITDYRTRLGGRLEKTGQEGVEGVDIFRIHNTWIPMFRQHLSPVPSDLVTKIGLENNYWDVYKDDLKENNNWLSIPIMYDGLALFYNQELLDEAKIPVPNDWWELEQAAKKLTVKDNKGNIEISGVGMGIVNGNVDHWSDILGLMMKQNGINFTQIKTGFDKNLEDVLKYYASFAKSSTYVWNENLPNTTSLFANGKLAFYFGPSWRVFDIEKLNKNLKYRITTVPQLPISGGITDNDTELTNIHWATYWTEGVNNKSKYQAEAWKFLEYLSSKEVLEKLYTAESQTRSFGEIYPKKSMSESLKNNPKVWPFVSVADSAKSWYLASATGDDGLNTEMQKYFANAVNQMTMTGDATVVITNLKNGITQLQTKYGLRK
jgi:multiple sugar transport system substrate-binding protein